MKKLVSLLLLAIFVLGGMSVMAEGKDSYTFAILYANVHPFFDSVGNGALDKVKELGMDITMILQGAQNGNVSQQIQIMEDLITQKIDGIAIGPCDSEALTPYIDKAVEAGIPVLCYDTDAPESKRAGYVGTNNYNAGRAMGEELGKALNGKGIVLCETGVVSQAGLIQRKQGVEDVLAESYPDIKIVQTTASGGDVSKAQSDIENMITAYPDFDALIQLDAAGEAGITAFKAHDYNKDNKVLIVFDDLEPVIDGVKEGIIYCTITQGQRNWGATAVEELLALCNGEQVPENADTGYVTVNADNVNELYPD